MRIDQIIKDRLKNSTPTSSTPDWDRMEQALDAAADAESTGNETVDESLFDQAVKSSLPLTAGAVKGWERMELELNELQATTTETFDELVSQKINNSHLSGAPSWATLDTLLTNYENWRKKVISYRVLEAALLFLFLFILFQQGGQFSSSPKELANKSSKRFPSTQDIDQNSASFDADKESSSIHSSQKLEKSQGPELAAQNVDKISLEVKSSYLLETQQETSFSDEKGNLIKLKPATIVSKKESKTSGDEASSRSSQSIPTPMTFIEEGQTEEKIANAGDEMTDIERSNDAINEKTVKTAFAEEALTSDRQGILKQITLLKSQIIWDNRTRLNPPNNITPLTIQNQKLGWSYAYHIDTDINQITSEPDLALGTAPFERYQIGHGIGFRVNRDMGRVHLESGVSFHYLSYSPRSVMYVQSGSYETQYDGIGITAIKKYTALIPLEIQYNLVDNDRFRLYGIGGVNAHITVRSTYDLNNMIAHRDPEPQSGLMLQALDPAPLAMAPNEITQAEYESGMASSNTLTESSYFTLNLGAGLDYKLNNRIALYGSYTYRHRLNPKDFGPYRDRFRTGTVSTGVRVLLINAD